MESTVSQLLYPMGIVATIVVATMLLMYACWKKSGKDMKTYMIFAKSVAVVMVLFYALVAYVWLSP
jgi:hypothetical protein